MSKSYAVTGVRVGYIAIQDKKMRARAAKVALYTASNVCSIAQYGAIGADPISGMVVDASGKIYLTGTTSSSALPVTSGAQQRGYSGGNDGYIAIIEPDRNTGDAGSLLISNSRPN